MALADAVTRDRSSVRVTTGKVVGAAGNRARVMVSGSELTLPRLAWYPVTAGDTVNILVSDAGWLVLGPTGAVTGGGGGAGSPGPAGRSVTSATVNGAGRLILTMSDDTTVDAGAVVGPPGTDGSNGAAGAPGAAGADGADGSDGVSVVDVDIDANQHLIVTLSDGSTIDAGAVSGGSSGTGGSGPRSAGGGPVRMSEAPVRFGKDLRYSAFPSTARLADGRLVMVWREGADHVTGRDGLVRISWSSDEGRTWTTPGTAAPYPGGGVDLRDPCIAASTDGSTLWLTYFKGTSALAAAGCFLRISTNNGVTWGAEIRIDPSQPYAAICSPIVQVGSTLVTTYYGRLGSETRDSVFVARSTNGGASWTTARVANGQTDGRDYQEPWVCPTGNGLIVMFRWNTAESFGLIRSTNSGASWTTPAVAFTSATGRPSAAWTSTGALVCVYRRIADGVTVYRSSRDNGATWGGPQAQQVITGSGWMTYAGPVEIAPGLIFCPVGIEESNGAVSRTWLSYIADGGGVSPLGDNFPDRVSRIVADLDPIVAADDFDRSDSTAAAGLGAAPTGQPWQPGGRIEAGTARSGTPDFVPEYPIVETRTPNVQVDADFLWTGDSGFGIMLRYRDVNNHMMFTVEGGGVNVRFYVRNAGTYYVLSEAASVPFAAGQWRRLTAIIRGNRFLGFIDGQLVLAYTIGQVDMDLLSTYTWHGLKFNESASSVHRCRRFLVRS